MAKEQFKSYEKAVMVTIKVPLSEIESFCSPCDNYLGHARCKVLSEANQAKRVDNRNCRHAAVEGITGIMRSNGFTPIPGLQD